MPIKTKVTKANKTTETTNKEATMPVKTKVKSNVVRRGGAKTTAKSETVKAKAKAVEVEETEEEDEEEEAPVSKFKRGKKKSLSEADVAELKKEISNDSETEDEAEEEAEEAPKPTKRKSKTKVKEPEAEEPEAEEEDDAEEEEEEPEPKPVVKKKTTKAKAKPEVEEVEEEEEELNEQFRNPALRRLSADKLEDVKVLRKIYEEQVGDRKSLPKKATAEEILNEIEGDWLLENKAADEGFATATSELLMVKLADIDICPLNPRHRLDYLDDGLQSLIRKSNGLIKTITVTPADTMVSRSKVKYFVVAGNRSFSNYVAVLEQQGVDMAEAEIGVVVRHYDAPTQSERQAQLLAELENDNDAAAQFTPIDRLKLINAKLALGRTKASIAREKGWTPAYVTQLTSLNVLPERILDLVHFNFRSDLLSGKTPAELSKNGVPHTVDEAGNVKVNGISYNNAMTLASMFPREKDFSSTEEYEQELARVSELVESNEIIEMAIHMTEQQFTLAMYEHRPVTRKGKTLKIDTKSKDVEPEDVDVDIEDDVDEDEAPVSKSKSKANEKLHPVVKLLMTAPEKLAKELREDEPKYDFTADSLKILATKVEEEDPMALKCLRYLVDIGAFDEYGVE